MYKVKMTKLVTLLVGISLSLSLGIFFFFSITKRIWRFSSLRKQTAFSVLFPALKTNKNLISFRMKMTSKRGDRALQSRFTHAE
jgi:hypothetical protein